MCHCFFVQPVHALCGGIAGASVDAVLFPIDTLKTRLQAASSTTAVAKRRSLYSGFGINAYGSFLSSASFFMGYEAAKSHLQPLVAPQFLPFVHMASAAAADVGACVMRVPFEILKQRLQAGLHATTSAAALHVYHTNGLRGFYTGFWSTVAREVPFDAMEFALYELLRRQYLLHVDRPTPSGAESGLLGGFAGGVAAAATTPLDVVKTRLMTQTAKRGEPGYYNGMRHCFRRILEEEGARSLFRGILPRTIWISLGGSIFFAAYETSKSFFLSEPTSQRR